MTADTQSGSFEKNKMTIAGGVVALLILSSIFFIALSRQNSVTSPVLEKANLLRGDLNGPVITFESDSGKTAYKTGDNITVTLRSNSQNQPITGFDVVIPVDSGLTYQGVKSLNEDFDVYGKLTKGELAVTGIKKISATNPAVLDNSPVAAISFTAAKAGMYQLESQFKAGATDDSNLINEKTEDILTGVSGVSIEVK